MTGCKKGILQNVGEKDRRILARRMAKYSQEDDRILTVTRKRTNFGQEDSKILYMRVTKTWEIG